MLKFYTGTVFATAICASLLFATLPAPLSALPSSTVVVPAAAPKAAPKAAPNAAPNAAPKAAPKAALKAAPVADSLNPYAKLSDEELQKKARALSLQFKHKEAEPLIVELVKREPKTARYHFILAKCLIEQGRFPKALEELLEASFLEPGDNDARFEMAQVYVYQGRFKDAAMVLEQIKKKAPFLSRDSRRADGALASIASYYDLDNPYSKSYADPEADMPWQRSDFPIKVAIWSDPEMTEWKEPFRQAVIESFSKWRDASGGWLRFQIVDDQRQAKIVCKLVGVMRGSKYEGGGEKLGETLGDYDNKNADVRGFSRVEIFWGPDSNPGHFKHVVLHEVGHSLGLGHSNNTLDVMYPFVHPPYVEYPSRRDSSSLRALYGIK